MTAPAAKLDRILETALYVDDLDRAREFYRRVLALETMFETETLVAFDVSGRSVLLIFQRGASLQTQKSPDGEIPPHDGAGPLHICFAIAADQLAPWEARLREHGVSIEGRMRWPRGGESLYFRDPDRHLLELMTPGNWPNYQ